jgi:hypothetical protein
MTLFHEVGTAVLMVIVTLWLQCAGLAVLIVWVRRAVTADVHLLGPFRSAALVVRLTAAVIALHGLLILLWAFGPRGRAILGISGSLIRRFPRALY